MKLLKKLLGLGGLLLSCNIGCNSRFQEASPKNLQQVVSETSEQELPENKPKMKAWQYPANVIGGICLSSFTHESAHALSLISMGYDVCEYRPIPFLPNNYGFTWGYVRSSPDFEDGSNSEKAFYRISGPLSDIALIESINYNLRNGNISESHQPFWATTSLVTRALLLNNTIQGLYSKDVLHTANDFRGLENVSDITVEQSFGAIGLYTLLNYGRIKAELNAATGKKCYPTKKKSGLEVEIVPSLGGVGLAYVKKF